MALKETIYALLTTDTTLQNLLGGTASNKKVFYNRSGDTVQNNIPCITFEFKEVPETPNLLHKTSEDGELYIDIWSAEQNVDDIYNRIKVLLKAAKKPLESDLVLAFDMQDEVKSIHRRHIQYTIKGG
jgi:hypothetical protein